MVKILFLIAWSFTASTLEGVVTVLEAPVFRKPDINEQVILWRRKGEKIYVHEIHNQGNLEKRNVIEFSNVHGTNELVELEKFLISKERESEFFKTIDKNGGDAYMLKKHVKVVFGDNREHNRPISEFREDLTDYRLAEPLPQNYPFTGDQEYRAFFQLGVGLPTTQTYEYAVDTTETIAQPSFHFSAYGFKRAQVEKNQRLFIGGMMQVGYSYLSGKIGTAAVSETLVDFGIGPAITYDAYVGKSSTLSLTGAISLNLVDTQQIEVEDQSVTFRGITVTPIFSAQYHIPKIVSDLDFVFGPQVKVGLPFTLSRATDQPESTSLFGNTEEIRRELRTELSIQMGVNRTF